MPILTSRPPANPVPSTKDLMDLVTPAVDVLSLLSSLIIYTVDSKKSVSDAQQLIEDALDCFKFADYAVMSAISVYSYELVYDVAVQPVQGSAFISFKVIFQVRP